MWVGNTEIFISKVDLGIILFIKKATSNNVDYSF